MKTLFKERSSKFGSLLSLVAVTAMMVLFVLTLPAALVSNSGRIFATLWATTAILLFSAHARRLSGERRYPPDLVDEKDIRVRQK